MFIYIFQKENKIAHVLSKDNASLKYIGETFKFRGSHESQQVPSKLCNLFMDPGKTWVYGYNLVGFGNPEPSF